MKLRHVFSIALVAALTTACSNNDTQEEMPTSAAVEASVDAAAASVDAAAASVDAAAVSVEAATATVEGAAATAADTTTEIEETVKAKISAPVTEATPAK